MPPAAVADWTGMAGGRRVASLLAVLALDGRALAQKAPDAGVSPQSAPSVQLEDKEVAALVRAALAEPCTKRYGGCDDQDECRRKAQSCGNLAADFAYGILDFPRDPRRSRALHVHACKAGDAYSCAMAASQYREDKVRDPAKEIALIREGCLRGTEVGTVDACSELWHPRQLTGVSREDRYLGVRRLRELCDDGDDSACRALCEGGDGCVGVSAR